MIQPSLMARAWRGAAPWLGAVVLVMGLAPALACSPRASSVPLGLGPLAIAERDAQAQAETSRQKRASKPARRPALATAPANESPAKPAPATADTNTKPPAGEESSSADSAGAAAPARFEGLYAGEDIAVYRWGGAPEQEQRDDKAKIRIEKASGGNLSITLINSADGSDLCDLVARVEGNAALIESPQSCFGDGGEGSPEAELTSGRAVLEGDRLSMNAQGTLSLALPDQELDGEITYTFEGERQ